MSAGRRKIRKVDLTLYEFPARLDGAPQIVLTPCVVQSRVVLGERSEFTFAPELPCILDHAFFCLAASSECVQFVAPAVAGSNQMDRRLHDEVLRPELS